MSVVAKKRFNILYTTSFSHMMGGGQWSLYYLIKHLNKEIYCPIVLCPEEGKLAEHMRKVGADVVYCNVARMRYLDPLVILNIVSIIKKRKIALIHTDSSTETFYAGIAAKVMRIPLIWHIRVTERQRFLDKILSLLSTRLIFVAHNIGSQFTWLHGTHKMVVIHNGIDLKEFDSRSSTPSIRKEYAIDPHTVLLSCIGRIEERKGQAYLISAMRQIDHARLILVGSGDDRYMQTLKNFWEQHKVSDRILYIGYRDDIPSLLKDIDIFVFPVIRGEGFARVILEAMASGIPVIATDDAGNPEAIVNGITGYIVKPLDDEALVAKINELVADKNKRIQMGKAGRKRVEEYFTIQQTTQKIQKVYQSLLKDRAERGAG